MIVLPYFFRERFFSNVRHQYIRMLRPKVSDGPKVSDRPKVSDEPKVSDDLTLGRLCLKDNLGFNVSLFKKVAYETITSLLYLQFMKLLKYSHIS